MPVNYSLYLRLSDYSGTVAREGQWLISLLRLGQFPVLNNLGDHARPKWSASARVCPMCLLGLPETEEHFLTVCPAYSHLRQKWVESTYNGLWRLSGIQPYLAKVGIVKSGAVRMGSPVSTPLPDELSSVGSMCRREERVLHCVMSLTSNLLRSARMSSCFTHTLEVDIRPRPTERVSTSSSVLVVDTASTTRVHSTDDWSRRFIGVIVDSILGLFDCSHESAMELGGYVTDAPTMGWGTSREHMLWLLKALRQEGHFGPLACDKHERMDQRRMGVKDSVKCTTPLTTLLLIDQVLQKSSSRFVRRCMDTRCQRLGGVLVLDDRFECAVRRSFTDFCRV